jgi:Protein of unknown function (DUF790)
MLKLADLRKTTRRSGDMRVVYPRFLRDRALAPRIEMAIRYLESMLGHPRRELDGEVIVQLFGDHKLARCIVACLAASYRHRPRTFAEVLPAGRAEALAGRGLSDPSTLRLWIFRRVNAEIHGFAGRDERPGFITSAADELGIAPADLDILLSLDAPEHAILVRLGPKPTADDIIARFNFETVAALLANAAVVRMPLHRAPADAETIPAVCELAGVHANLSRRELVLTGRQDAFGGWARHGARLARLVTMLLACGLPARSAEAQVAAPDGSGWLFRMDREILGFLGAPEDARQTHYSTGTLLESWQQSGDFADDFAALRRHGLHEGWTLRRATEPVILANGIAPTLFVAANGEQRVPLALAPTSDTGWEQIAAFSARVPLIVLDMAAEAEDRDTADEHANILALRYSERADLLVLPEMLSRAASDAEHRAGMARLESLLDEAATAGVLIESRLAQHLGCHEEELPARLDVPANRNALRTRELRYIEGFGLCTASMLTRVRDATSDVTDLRDNPSVGTAWLLRVLGRKLREVTGASEGIECLIAYLGAA